MSVTPRIKRLSLIKFMKKNTVPSVQKKSENWNEAYLTHFRNTQKKRQEMKDDKSDNARDTHAKMSHINIFASQSVN